MSTHRSIGNIDIYNFGLWQFADQMVYERLGIEIDYSHEYHTVFTFNDALTDWFHEFILISLGKRDSFFRKVTDEDWTIEKYNDNYFVSSHFKSCSLKWIVSLCIPNVVSGSWVTKRKRLLCLESLSVLKWIWWYGFGRILQDRTCKLCLNVQLLSPFLL